MRAPQDNVTGEILLVDDNPDNLKLLAKMLTAHGFLVKASDSGRYALKSMRTNPPDLLLLDIKMPDMDGYEVCRQLKADPVLAHIPVMFMSGLKEEENKVKGFELGAVDYITKPFQSQEILARVRTHLAMSRMQQNLEDMVRERTSKLQAATEHFQRLFELASDAFFIHDFDGTIIDVNRQTCNSLGYSRKELLHLKVSEIEICLSHAQIIVLCQKADAGQRVIAEGVHRRKDGSTFPVEVSLALFQEQEPRLLLAIARDISERKQAEDALHTLNDELELRVKQRTAKLEATNQELEDFAYIVSHDLKAPLRGINYLAHWLHTDYADALGERGREQLDLLIGRARRLDSLIDGILRYSRATRDSEREEPTDMNVLVSQVIEMLSPSDCVNIRIERKLPSIVADPTKLTQVFQNLLSNALKFMDKADGEITIGYEDVEEILTFWVADNGPGIEVRNQERIFQIFQSCIPRDEHESTGIGLTVVKKIVEFYGGRIWVESAPGQGSRFVFNWPKRLHEQE